MKKIIILAIVLVVVVFVLVLAEAFLRRPLPGISPAGESTEVQSNAILL